MRRVSADEAVARHIPQYLGTLILAQLTGEIEVAGPELAQGLSAKIDGQDSELVAAELPFEGASCPVVSVNSIL
jgi:hypothetical protein